VPRRLRRVRRLATEILFSLSGRPLTAAVSTGIVALGVGGLVATTGIATATSTAITSTLDELASTTVIVTPNPEGPAGPAAITADATTAAQLLQGVHSAAVISELLSPREAFVRDFRRLGSANRAYTDVVGVTELAGQAAELNLAWGVPLDGFHHDTRSRVALVGRHAAARLGLNNTTPGAGISVDGRILTVLGVIQDAPGRPGLLDAIVVPHSTLTDMFGPAAATALIRVQPGYAQAIAHAAPFALAPANPHGLTATLPPQFTQQRQAVDADLTSLLYATFGILAGLGVLSIAVTSYLSVTERAAEIGLRRALGAGPAAINAQFLGETTAIGLFGGLLGTSVGLTVLLAVSAAEGWQVWLNPWTALGGPAAGALVGIAAGLVPARRAARLDPATALRKSIEI